MLGLGGGGCHIVARLSQGKTCPKARPPCTDNRAAWLIVAIDPPSPRRRRAAWLIVAIDPPSLRRRRQRGARRPDAMMTTTGDTWGANSTFSRGGAMRARAAVVVVIVERHNHRPPRPCPPPPPPPRPRRSRIPIDQSSKVASESPDSESPTTRLLPYRVLVTIVPPPPHGHPPPSSFPRSSIRLASRRACPRTDRIRPSQASPSCASRIPNFPSRTRPPSGSY